jgi:hypothetical protein
MDDDLQARIETFVRAGYLTRDGIVEALEELVDDSDDDVSAAHVAAAVDAAIADHRAQASAWRTETDNDRLDRAFSALEAGGVIARQDFACCTNCAHAEIWDEVSDPSAWRGNVWFHQQDTERAIEGGGLYLGYGAREKPSAGLRLRWAGASDANDDTAIGREVAKALTDAGLPVIWDGRVETRIFVNPFVWRRRPPV